MAMGEVLAWHVHHEKLIEPLTGGGLEERRAYIRAEKPAKEQEVRLRLLRPVKDQARARKLWDAMAWEAYEKAMATARKAYEDAMAPARKAYEDAMVTAWEAYEDVMATAREAYQKAMAPARKAYEDVMATAREAYQDAMAPVRKALEALHREECPDCPWDGQTIFPGRRG